jgi:hypothetical protein
MNAVVISEYKCVRQGVDEYDTDFEDRLRSLRRDGWVQCGSRSMDDYGNDYVNMQRHRDARCL